MKKKECPSCAMEVEADSKVCPVCGYEFPGFGKGIQWVAILLVLLMLLFFIL
ncbi:zinc ribbon domain-containing protein [Fulvivirga ulvae]|uniref:zinc ribbon domain-containing protein n=1 Tax=Fulvivirga ulvae TaxID=2904245 RepID=UPI001F3B9521|nr:zinc ribbon domain-containing protein [Fulvivirga ulvae]UII32491.1 zinc ribbon domain-containing protein [Fulvivirga ulvae]